MRVPRLRFNLTLISAFAFAMLMALWPRFVYAGDITVALNDPTALPETDQPQQPRIQIYLPSVEAIIE